VIEAMERQSDVEPPKPLRLRSHSIAPADPTIVLEVMQTLLAGQPGVRLAIDPESRSLIALATETHHALIKTTIQELQRGRPAQLPFRIVPKSSRDIDGLVANLQAIWTRNNGIRIATPAATGLPPLREITASRLRAPRQGGEPGGKIDRQSSEDPRARGPKKLSHEEGAGDPDCNSPLFLRLPIGPVRIVPIEALDLILIRGG